LDIKKFLFEFCLQRITYNTNCRDCRVRSFIKILKILSKKKKMIDKNSFAYRCGRFFGKVVLVSIGYLLGTRLGRREINKGFPETPTEGGQ
jgi:hypothetical protein